MKRVIGVIMIIAGLIMIATAIGAMKQQERINDTPRGRFQQEFSPHYNAVNQNKQEEAMILGGAGVLVLIFGIIFAVSKPAARNHISTSGVSDSNSREVTQLSKKAVDLYNRGDYEGAIPVLKRITVLNPVSEKAYFNLSCCYSKLQNSDCFPHLEKAVANGYSDFNTIRSHSALNWMRNQPGWESFVKNGYELKAEKVVEVPKPEENKTTMNEDYLTQLERLGQLRERGLLTEEEFQEQKKRILEKLG